MIRLALRMLFGDTAKYLMLLVGLFFATFLMAQQSGCVLWPDALDHSHPQECSRPDLGGGGESGASE